MSDPLRVVLFDCDGTLADSEAAIAAAAHEAFTATGLAPPPAARVRRYIGRSLPQALSDLATDMGLTLDPTTFDALVAAFRQAYMVERQQRGGAEPLFDGMAECLQRLDGAGYLLGIVTGKSRRGLTHLLAGHSLNNTFLVTRTADDGPGKPQPDLVLDALSELGAAPHWSAVVGDTGYDMAMAKAAGAAPIGVGWGVHDTATLAAHGAATVCTQAGDLEAAIRQAIGRPGEGGEAA